MSTLHDSESEQDRLEDETFQRLLQAALPELRALARRLARTPDDQLFGRGEFAVRADALRLGAVAFDAALAARKKGGIKVPASVAPRVGGRRGSSGIVLGASRPSVVG